MNKVKINKKRRTTSKVHYLSKQLRVILSILLVIALLAALIIIVFNLRDRTNDRSISRDQTRLAGLFSEVTLPKEFMLQSSKWEAGSLDVSEQWTYDYTAPDIESVAYNELITRLQNADYRIIPEATFTGAPECKDVKYIINAVNRENNIQAYITLSSESRAALSGGDCTTELLAPQKIEIVVSSDEWDQTP